MKTHFYHSDILEICTQNHLTVEGIFERVKVLYPQAGFSTIYRNVEELTEKWLLKKISGIGSKALFERNMDGHIAHFVDDSTGAIYDIHIPEEFIFAQLPAGFSPHSVDLRIYWHVSK